METASILAAIVRVLHVGSAIALLGGALYAVTTQMLSLRVVDEGLRGSILEAARRRFYRTAHPALLILVATGFCTFMRDMKSVYKPMADELGPMVHGLLGVKILLALVILAIVFAQTFKVIKTNPIRWARINLALGTVIIIIAAIVRQMRVDFLMQ